MRVQNNRIRPEDLSARGTNTRVPENNKTHCSTSLKAVSWNECGRIRAASANTARQPMMPTDQSFELVAKTLPRTHSRARHNRSAGYCSNLLAWVKGHTREGGILWPGRAAKVSLDLTCSQSI